MEKELIHLLEAVKKAAEKAATASCDCELEESRCLDVFKLLKMFPVNYKILKATEVGKRLRVLTKHPREKIKASAMDVIEIWKDKISKEVSKNKKGKVDHNKAPEAKEKSPSSTVSPSSEQKTVIKCEDERRNKIREILIEAFSKVLTEADEAIMDQVKACDLAHLSVTVESLLFQNWGRFAGDQRLKYRSLIFNLSDRNNPDFRRRVVVGEIAPELLASMETHEMASDKRKAENEKIKRKALYDCELEGRAKATTDQFVCGKCRKRECTYYQMQTRSADEPMTTYVTCVSCNHHWKFC